MNGKSDDINELAAALVSFQYELTGAKKDSANPYFKSRYADLESCLSALKEPLHKHGLAVVQTSKLTNNGPVLITTLMHKSGQWIEGELPLSAAKQNDPQAQGSAITYARRYALAAITGLVQIDDDAELAMGRGGKTEPVKKLEATSSPAKEPSKLSSVSTAASVKPPAEPKAADKNPEPSTDAISHEHMGQLLKFGLEAGWTRPQISGFLYSAFSLTPKTITDLTFSQWEKTIRLLSRPENNNGSVSVDEAGKPLAADSPFLFPRG